MIQQNKVSLHLLLQQNKRDKLKKINLHILEIKKIRNLHLGNYNSFITDFLIYLI